MVDDFEPVHRTPGADLLRGSERPSGEDRDAPQQRGLGGSEQVVAPLEGSEQRLVAGGGGGAGAVQDAEAVVEALEDVGGRERGDACGSQLDGQRHPVEPAADLRHRGRRRIREAESWIGFGCPLEEQLTGFTVAQ